VNEADSSPEEEVEKLAAELDANPDEVVVAEEDVNQTIAWDYCFKFSI